MNAGNWASLTIDCDALSIHHAVWGLPEPAPGQAEAFFCGSLETALAFLRERGIAATFFVVGSLVPDMARELLREIATVHEIGNHTWSHPWDLSRMEEDAVAVELEENHRFLEGFGAPVCGFRAPGYHLSPAVLRVLVRMGYRYSSSQMTGVVYPLAKAAVSAWLRLRGRQSRTVMHPVGDALTPRWPYRPDFTAPRRPGKAPLWEIPVATSAWGLPTVGPFVHAFSCDVLFAPPAGRPWIFNFHLTDFADGAAVPELARFDSMMRIPRARRLERMARLVEFAQRRGWVFLPLRQACRAFKP